MDNFLCEIRIFPFSFAPHNWAFCNGQILPIASYTAVFSLLGTFYGGNGTTNFGLPNIQNSAMLQPGNGNGLSVYQLGEQSGIASVTLIQSEIPTHTHDPRADGSGGGLGDPSGNVWGMPTARRPQPNLYSTAAGSVSMHPLALSVTGGSGAHNNLMPYVGLNFCIALQGIYPQRP